jgi:hypothetical protein
MPSTGLRYSFSEYSLQLGSWGGRLLVGFGDGYGYGFDVAYFMERIGWWRLWAGAGLSLLSGHSN